MNRIKSPTSAHLDQLSAFLEKECQAIKLDDIEIADRKKAITQLEANMHQNPLLAGKSRFSRSAHLVTMHLLFWKNNLHNSTQIYTNIYGENILADAFTFCNTHTYTHYVHHHQY